MAKILLVDDDESTLRLVYAMLVSGGHTVETATNGQEAMDILKERHVAVVVTDLRMPTVNGLRLIRELRSAGDTVPIVAISGANRDQLLLAQDYGANAALVKPVDRKELLKVVRMALDDTRDAWSNAWIHPEFGSVGER